MVRESTEPKDDMSVPTTVHGKLSAEHLHPDGTDEKNKLWDGFLANNKATARLLRPPFPPPIRRENRNLHQKREQNTPEARITAVAGNEKEIQDTHDHSEAQSSHEQHLGPSRAVEFSPSAACREAHCYNIFCPLFCSETGFSLLTGPEKHCTTRRRPQLRVALAGSKTKVGF